MSETRTEFSERYGKQVRAWLRSSAPDLADSLLTAIEEDTLKYLWDLEKKEPTEEFVRNVARTAALIERHNDGVRATEELAFEAAPYIKDALNHRFPDSGIEWGGI